MRASSAYSGGPDRPMSTYLPPPRPSAYMLRGLNRVLNAPFSYSWGDWGKYWKLTIPAGFVWDQASIPRAVWSIIAPSDLHPAAGLLHDWPYRWAGAMPQFYEHTGRAGDVWVPAARPMTRREADILFSNIIRVTGTPRIQRWPVYSVVRLFGHGSFERADNPMDRDRVLENYPELQAYL